MNSNTISGAPPRLRTLPYLCAVSSSALILVSFLSMRVLAEMFLGFMSRRVPAVPLPAATGLLLSMIPWLRVIAVALASCTLAAGVIGVRRAAVAELAMRRALVLAIASSVLVSVALFLLVLCLVRPFMFTLTSSPAQ